MKPAVVAKSNMNTQKLISKKNLADLKKNSIWIIQLISKYLTFILAIFLIIYCSYEYHKHELNLLGWDWLLISGILVFMIDFSKAKLLEKKWQNVVNYLISQKILKLRLSQIKINSYDPKKQSDQFLKIIESESKSWKITISCLIAVSILMAFTYSYLSLGKLQTITVQKFLLTLFEVFLAWIAGWYLGQVLFNGLLFWKLQKQKKICWKIQPEHPDGVSGLKRITLFFLEQAEVAAYPIMFLGIWVMIWKLCKIEILQKYQFLSNFLALDQSILCHYKKDWGLPYIVLLVLATLIELIALIIPLIFLHKSMKRNKEKKSKTLDKISLKIIDLKQQIEQIETQQQYQELDFQLSLLKQKYLNIVQAPTWSIDTKEVLQVVLAYSIPSLMTILQFIKEVWGFIDPVIKGLQKAI